MLKEHAYCIVIAIERSTMQGKFEILPKLHGFAPLSNRALKRVRLVSDAEHNFLFQSFDVVCIHLYPDRTR